MKLTAKLLKKLIKEEMQVQTLNEGTATILVLLFLNRYLKQENSPDNGDRQLPVESSKSPVEKVLLAALILNVIASLSGALMEEMDYNREDVSDGMHRAIVEAIPASLNLSPDEVSTLIAEYDLINFYNENS